VVSYNNVASPWTIVDNVSLVCHAFSRLRTKNGPDIVACTKVCVYNPTKISIRFQWLSKVVAQVDPTLHLVYVLYFVQFVLVLNIQSVLYIETTERKLKTCPLWAVGRYLTPVLITSSKQLNSISKVESLYLYVRVVSWQVQHINVAIRDGGSSFS
jgi:hypothetical protein